jgi:divalent metal cation (Fe/Co/Zn/Cd) transporter
MEDIIRRIIKEFNDISGYHGLQIFHGKEGFVIALDIVLPGGFPLVRSHEIAKKLKEKILNIDKVKDVVIHMDIQGKENE